MKKNSLFVEEYNKANMINIKSDLDIYDECEFSYLDILKEKEVKVPVKTYKDCKCLESVNFNSYYNKCDKCNGDGKYSVNGNVVFCNHCRGKGRIIKEVCPICNGEGKVIKKENILVKLDKNLKDNDVITLKGKGKYSNDIKGDLFIKVTISDRECFDVINKDVYDKRMIDFSKEEINKGISKEVETVKGVVNVKSSNEVREEIVRLIGEGIDGGDYIICLNNELTPIKGEDVYKNVIVNKNMLGFYIYKQELKEDKKCLSVFYYRKLNQMDYEYIDLVEANNFKIVKLKGKGLSGKNGGVNGDLYLRVYFDDEFVCVNDKLYYKPIKLNKYEINDGKKTIEFNKNKIILNFSKNLKQIETIEVDDFGFKTNKNDFDSINIMVSPFEWNVYNVSVKVNKRDKVIYLKDYKKYFNELVSFNYDHGLKVNLNKKSNHLEVRDEFDDIVNVNVIR